MSSGNSQQKRILGRVKWFNNKTGYGFITIIDEDKKGYDVFVHHSAIMVNAQQYKYLVQGEYVNFSLSKADGGKYDFYACDVTGLNDCKLMCETRNENRQSQNARLKEKSIVENVSTELDKQPETTIDTHRPRSVTIVQEKSVSKLKQRSRNNVLEVRQ